MRTVKQNILNKDYSWNSVTCGSCAIRDTLSKFGVKNGELARKLLSGFI